MKRIALFLVLIFALQSLESPANSQTIQTPTQTEIARLKEAKAQIDLRLKVLRAQLKTERAVNKEKKQIQAAKRKALREQYKAAMEAITDKD